MEKEIQPTQNRNQDNDVPFAVYVPYRRHLGRVLFLEEFKVERIGDLSDSNESKVYRPFRSLRQSVDARFADDGQGVIDGRKRPIEKLLVGLNGPFVFHTPTIGRKPEPSQEPII